MWQMATIMALMRGLHMAAIISLLGTTGFLTWVLPGAGPPPGELRRRLVRVWWVSGLAALLAGVGWFVLQAAAIAGAEHASDLWAALPVVAEHTRYGNMLVLRLALLLVATLLGLAGRGVYPALIVTAVAACLQGFVGHAGATGGATGDGLVASEALHLLAAGLWLGALLPFWISLRALPPALGGLVCHRFSPIGLACVLVLAGTGLAQALELIGSVPALFGTRYGHIAALKIGLFLLALILAAVNRLWLSDRLAAKAAHARRHLLISVGVETCVGLGIIAAAAFLASSVPGVHEAPVWPFSWQFSLVTLQEDADFRREVVVSLMAIGGAVLLAAGALLWRRLLPAAAPPGRG